MTDTLTYTHLYTDAEGESHFQEKQFEFHPLDDASWGESLTFKKLQGVKGASLAKLKKGAEEDWHTAPRKQFIIVIQGAVEITASDGKIVRLVPGSVMLVDDTTGKGHTTKDVGDEEHIALMLPLVEE